MTECQRLISVSLGKIAASRSNRSGINLHKNLMVSCVLNRARTAFYEESLAWYNSRHTMYEPPVMDYRDTSGSGYDSDTDMSECESSAVSTNSAVNAHCTSPTASDYTTTTCSPAAHSPYHETENKENVHPSCHNVVPDQHYIVTKPAEKVDTFDCDSDPSESHKKSYTVLTSPTKRKLSEVEAAVESIQPKRQKCSDCFDADCSHAESPQTEQISTLVNYLNSGFTSLLTVSDISTSSSSSCSSVNEQRGSCWSATQGRPLLDSFESVSPPVIVMTV
ncbi:PREDICTED: immediate early response gene 5-like protein [Priapulus caudatus]|uniref:Immediate early response gene 5-like protein n=1 Tax=Priapulus caudatus TaxID=37621 RepID=A0ABM1DR97_PRICU|nr:PREDICTED: immediate early response gene 5-like protein [Priapulus caudatus]